MLTYNVHAGHAPAGGLGCGAVGILNESNEARKVKDHLVTLLRSAGNEVYDCTCNVNASAGNVLNKIVALCNAHAVDIDISIHLNSGRNDYTGDDSTGGVEVLLYNDELKDIAKNIAGEIAAEFGYRVRSYSTTPEGCAGVKIRPDLYVLKNTRAKAMLIECCFVDDMDDAEVWNPERCAKAICRGLGQDVKERIPEAPAQAPASGSAVKVDYAKDFNAEYAGVYTVNSPDGTLALRAGANTSKALIMTAKNGDKVRCFGYFTKEKDGTVWYLVSCNGQTGFMSRRYLNR